MIKGVDAADFNFANAGVHVKNTLVSLREQRFVFWEFENLDFCLEFIRNLAEVVGITNNIASIDVFVIQAFNFELDVFSWSSVENISILSVLDFLYLEGNLVRHHHDPHVFSDASRFDFSEQILLSLVFHSIKNGNSDRILLSLDGGDFIKDIKKTFA